MTVTVGAAVMDAFEVEVGMTMEEVPDVTFAGGGGTSPKLTPKRGE